MSYDPAHEAARCAALRREAQAHPVDPDLYVCRCDHTHPPDASWCYVCEYPVRQGTAAP